MCICGVTIIVLMLTKITVSSVPSYNLPYSLYSPYLPSYNLPYRPILGSQYVPSFGSQSWPRYSYWGGSLGITYFWRDFEDVDEFTDYNYEEYDPDEQMTDNIEDEIESQDYDDTDTWQYNDTDTWQYNHTETQQYNDNDDDAQLRQLNGNETQQYNDVEIQQYNDTDIWQYNDNETQQYNDTDIWQYNDNETQQNNVTEVEQDKQIEANLTNHTKKGQYNQTKEKLSNPTKVKLNNQAKVKQHNQTKVEQHSQIRLKESPTYKFIRRVRDRSACPDEAICARKCCPIGWGYDVSKETCVRMQDTFNPPIWKGYTLMEGIQATEELLFLEGTIICVPAADEVRKLVTDVSPVFRLKTDGKFYVDNPMAITPELIFKTNKYCMDLFITAENTTMFDALICHVEKNDIKRQYTLSGTCMLITCFLVLLRVVLFAWLPELRTLHGKILMAYLISFLVGFLLLGSQLLMGLNHIVNQNVCLVITFIVYFSILSAFFWRNVMCYDIWWTFSGKRAISGRGSSSRARFYLYCAYAFGGPTALTILLVGLEFSEPPSAFVHPLMPKVRIHGCLLCGYSKLLYFMGPIIILFVINMACFTLTALKIAAIKKETKMVLESKESCTHTQKKDTRRFALYVRLFSAMAFLEVNWILEVIAILYPDASILLHFSDVYNVLVPLIIFVNFLCQKKTWRMIKKRYRQMRRLPTSGGQTTGITSHTRSTQSQEDIEAQVTQLETADESQDK